MAAPQLNNDKAPELPLISSLNNEERPIVLLDHVTPPFEMKQKQSIKTKCDIHNAVVAKSTEKWKTQQDYRKVLFPK